MESKTIKLFALIGLMFLLIFVFNWPVGPFIYSFYLVFGIAFFTSDKWSKKIKYIVAAILVVCISILFCLVDKSNQISLITYSSTIAVAVLIMQLIKHWKQKR